MTRKPVLLIGDANVDQLFRLPAVDHGIDTLRDFRVKPHVGGMVGNTAMALARLGVKVELACAVGSDGYGDFIKRALIAAGVGTHHVLVVPDRFTPVVTFVIDRSGQHFGTMFPPDAPASRFYPPEKLDTKATSQASWLHSCAWLLGYSPISDTILSAMKEAKRAGVPISLDLNLRPGSDTLAESFRETIRRAVDLSDYVFGSSEGELALTTGISDTSEAAKALAGGQRTVIARFGSDGATVFDASGEVTKVSPFETEAVDTVGAGDVYNAGFITAMLERKSVAEAARWGNALAAISISREGASEHLTREALDALLAERG